MGTKASLQQRESWEQDEKESASHRTEFEIQILKTQKQWNCWEVHPDRLQLKEKPEFGFSELGKEEKGGHTQGHQKY